MKKKKFIIPTPACNQCGKYAPIDESMSNSQWTAYQLNGTCECGGIFRMPYLTESDIEEQKDAQ